MHLINIESLTNIRGLPLRRYILQEERIVITIFIFKITSERREGREEEREEGSSR
jgi:hypothetical protein